MMEGRDESEKLAATKMDIGTDVNFGALTRLLFKHLQTLPGFSIEGNREVEDIDPGEDKKYPWVVEVENLKTKDDYKFEANFV